MIYLLTSYFLIIAGFAILVYLTMRRSIEPRYKAVIYGALTFALLVGIFLTFGQYEKQRKTVSVPGQGGKR